VKNQQLFHKKILKILNL